MLKPFKSIEKNLEDLSGGKSLEMTLYLFIAIGGLLLLSCQYYLDSLPNNALGNPAKHLNQGEYEANVKTLAAGVLEITPTKTRAR